MTIGQLCEIALANALANTCIVNRDAHSRDVAIDAVVEYYACMSSRMRRAIAIGVREWIAGEPVWKRRS